MNALKLVLDIGAQKTGSKARQNFFSTQLKSNGPANTVFLESGREGIWHRPLFEDLQQGRFGALNELERETQRLGPAIDVGLVSYEELYLLDDSALKQIRSHFPDIEAVLFVRRQDELISSILNQLHKAHRITYAEICDFEREVFKFNRKFDFAFHFRRWESALGEGNVHVLPYSKDQSSIVAFLKETALLQNTNVALETRSNFALDGFGLGVLKEVKMMTEDQSLLPLRVDMAHKMLSDHFLTPGDTVSLFNRRDRQKIMSAYEASNTELSAYNERLKGYFEERPSRTKRLRLKRRGCAAFARKVIERCSE